MRTIALVLAVVFIAIASIDPLYCSDGCTRASLALTHHTQSGGDCPICQPGAAAIPPSELSAGTAVVALPFLPERALVRSFAPAIEHPPRPAA
jgi:hypothetical protein